MTKLIMLKGLPGAGQDQWVKREMRRGVYACISKDDLRDKILGGTSHKKEHYATQLRDELIRKTIGLGKSVIVNDYNLSPIHEKNLRALADELGATFVLNNSFLSVPPEDCIEQDAKRGENSLGAKAIWTMFYKWVAPKPNDYLRRSKDKPRAVICDLDGCLAQISSTRSPHDLSKVKQDMLDPFMGCIIDALYNYGTEADGSPYPRIIIVTSRSESARKDTEEWLETNLIPYDDLFMRKAGDIRPSVEVKEEIFQKEIQNKYAVLGAFEDNTQCARMYRKYGIRIAQMGLAGVMYE